MRADTCAKHLQVEVGGIRATESGRLKDTKGELEVLKGEFVMLKRATYMISAPIRAKISGSSSASFDGNRKHGHVQLEWLAPSFVTIFSSGVSDPTSLKFKIVHSCPCASYWSAGWSALPWIGSERDFIGSGTCGSNRMMRSERLARMNVL